MERESTKGRIRALFYFYFGENKKRVIKRPQIVRIAFNFKTIEAINHSSLSITRKYSTNIFRYFKQL